MLLKQRMENYEKLVVYSDAESHRLHEENKAMHVVALKTSLETKAMVSELSNVVVKLVQAVASGDIGKNDDEIIDRLFD